MLGGDSGTRTQTGIATPSVFKTVAARPARLKSPKNGGGTRIRTWDLRNQNPLFYQLNYAPTEKLAVPTRLELAASGVTGQRSNQLSYGTSDWWILMGSNQRHLACKASALPTELKIRDLVVLVGVEPTTCRLSTDCSRPLSYKTVSDLRLAMFKHTDSKCA